MAATTWLSVGPEARSRDPLFRRRMAGPEHRLLWRRLSPRGTAASNRRSQPHLSHGALSRGCDRILAAARRHAVRDSRPTISEWLARRDRNDKPQQLRCRGPVAARLAAYARRPAP